MSQSSFDLRRDSVTTRLMRSSLWIWFFLFLSVVVPVGCVAWRRFVGGQVVNASANLFDHVGVECALPKWIEDKIGEKQARPFGHVTQLSISGRAIGDTDKALRWLWWQPRLTWLSIFGRHCSNDSFAMVASNCANLESLSMMWGRLRVEDLQRVSTLRNLHELRLYEVAVPDEGLEPLANLPELRHLTLIANPNFVPDRVWESVSKLESVESLFLRASDSDLDALLRTRSDGEPVLPRLRHLTLHSGGASGVLTGRTLDGLSSLPKLMHLTLSETKANDDGLKHLEAATNLRQLYLAHCPITDEGCKSLAKLTNLESLHLGATGITIEGVRQLTGLKRLRQLTIKECYKIRDPSEIDLLPKSFLSRCRVVR